MESIYCGVSITDYGDKRIKPDCFYFEIVDDNDYYRRNLSYAEACKMMWELKLAGGTKEMRDNSLCPSISYRSVTYYVSHF